MLFRSIIDKLNIYGGKHYNFLPDSYGKKTYYEMNKEEQAVIDGFQGKDMYNKVMQDKNYYLKNDEMILISEKN